MENFSVVCEIIMIVLFGVSWPFNIVRAYKGRTTKGTSLTFLFLVETGYAAGIVSKISAGISEGAAFWTGLRITALCFYIVNFIMLFIAITIYFRNKKIDKIKRTAE